MDFNIHPCSWFWIKEIKAQDYIWEISQANKHKKYGMFLKIQEKIGATYGQINNLSSA